MKLLILTVLLSVVQTSPPIPRQTANSPANASNSSQQNTSPPNGPTDQTSAPVNKPEQTASHNEPSKEQSEADAQHSVSVRELPPVTVNNQRDWADWGTWFFTLLLAVTSALQVWLLCRTLIFARRQTHEIKRQRSYMRLQWVQMIEAGKQTERILAQMKEATQRELRAYVGPSAATIKCVGEAKYFAAIEIKNSGQTPAYKVRNFTDSYIGPYLSEAAQFKEPSASDVHTEGTLFPGCLFYGSKNVETSLLNDGHIFIYGKIEYQDVFKVRRWTRYRFIFPAPNTVLYPTIGELYPLTITEEGNGTEET